MENKKRLLLAEARSIAQDLLSKAKQDEYGVYWETRQTNGNAAIEWANKENLYSGDAGIILFLAELSRLDQDFQLKSIAHDACHALYQRATATPSENYAFYTGRSGIAYLFSLTADYFLDPSLHTKAVELMESSQSFLNCGIDDFLNGIAGTLFVLVFVHAHTQEKVLEPLIQRYQDKLMAKAHSDGIGLYWDRSGKNIKGLCGISHGSAGVGHVFRELSTYFGSVALEEYTSLAFAYEDQYFDTDRINWPDFRKGVYDEDSYHEHKQAYLAGSKFFFTETSDMAAWCHGAPGIGLTRISETPNANKGLAYAVQSTKQIFDDSSSNGSFTLCHGLGGNALLFTELSKLASSTVSWEPQLMELAERALKQKQKNGYYIPGISYGRNIEDTSLFLGNAGVGYFLLQVLSEEPLSNILIPKIPKGSISGGYTPVITSVGEMLIEKYFHKTHRYLDLKYPHIDTTFDSKHPATIVDFLHHRINEDSSAKKDLALQDVFALEAKTFFVDQKIESLCYLEINRRISLEEINHVIQTQQSNFNFQLSPSVEIHECTYDWNAFDGNASLDMIDHSSCTMLIIPSPEKTESIKLTEFSAFLIELLRKPVAYEQLVESSLDLFDHKSEDDKRQIVDFIHSEIVAGATMGIVSLTEKIPTQEEQVKETSTFTTTS